MRARIRRWGNSLALRIPKAFAEEASLEDESVVEPDVTLGQLLADVEERNLHGEVSTGRAVKSRSPRA